MKILKMVCLSFLCAFIFVSLAQAAGETKIGVLDLSKTFDGYEKTKEYDAVLEQKTKEYEKERNAKIDKLKEVEGKLALLQGEEKEKTQKEFDQLRQELLQYDQAQRTDLGKQRDERIREILLEIEKVVSDFAKKQGYDIILNDRVLIYGSDALDVTDQVLKNLNDSYNKK